jgi:hypothetical protein
MKKKILIAASIAALGCAVPALAGGPNAAAAAHAGVGASISTGSHGPSANAMENSNGRFAADRDFGRDRAEDRMSAQGAAHERASTAPNKKRGKPAPVSVSQDARTSSPR